MKQTLLRWMRMSFGLLLTVLATSPAFSQTLYGVSGSNLIRFSADSSCTVQNTVAITGIAAGQTISGLDFRPNTGQLYTIGYNDSTGQAQLYTLNLTTGAATSVGAVSSLMPGMGRISFDFNPTVDRIRVTGSNGANFRLHPTTGAIAATDTNLAFAGTDVNANATAFIGAGAYTNSYPGTASTTLYNYDVNLNILTTQNPPNAGTLNTVGSIWPGFNTPATSSDLDIYFDPATLSNRAFFVRNDTIANGSGLYSINLTTGAATLLCNIGNGLTVQYLAVQSPGVVTSPVTGQLVYALTANNTLITFDSDQPGQLQSIVAITGVTAGQMLCGIDFRPANGGLYGIGYNSTTGEAQLYTLNKTTGVATAVGAAINLGIGIGALGFDFNPVADAVRVTGSNGSNFRINATTGAIISTDSTLTFANGDLNQGGTASIGASAYSNSFDGATTTTLYNLGQGQNILTTQAPPNAGTLNTVGNLGIQLDTTSRTFDLDVFYDANTQTNTAFLAANPLGSANDVFYTINLTTAATTAVGNIGLGVQVKSIAVALDSVVSTAGVDLSLTASANPVNYSQYENVTYTVTVTNNGTSAAHNVVVDAGLVNGLVYTSSTVTQGEYNLFLQVWNVNTLEPGQSATLTLVLFPLVTDSVITNFFQISFMNESDTDSTPGNDTDNTANEDDEALVTIFGPAQPPQGGTTADLALFASLDSSQYNLYENVTFHLVLVNNGPDAAAGITVSAGLPQGFVYAGDTTASGQYNLFDQRWEAGYLASGDTARLDLTLFPLVSDSSVTNFFQVLTSDQDDPDSTPGNDTDNTPNEDDEAFISLLGPTQPPQGGDSADLALFATVDLLDYNIYENVTFHLVLVNNGPDDAAGITVSAGLPADFVYAGDNGGPGAYNLFSQRWQVGFLAAGDTARLDLTLFPLSDTTSVRNFFQVMTSNQNDPDSTPGNDTDNTPNEDDEALAILFGQEQPPQGGVTADLALFATTDSTHFNLYENVTYHLVLVNTGPDAAAFIKVSAGLPQGFVYAGDTATVGQYNLFNHQWEIPFLPVGDTARLDLSLFALTDSVNVNNFFEIVASNQNDPDSTPGNGANNEDDQVTVTLTPNLTGEPAENRLGQPRDLAVGILYPVPAETFINLQIDRAQIQEPAMIYFFNQQGRLVRTERTTVQEGSNNWRFEIAELPAGIYYVTLPGQLSPMKFIKM